MWRTGVAVCTVLLTFVIGCRATNTTDTNSTRAVCGDGYYDPPTCGVRCGNCREPPCDNITGDCDACEDGYDFSQDTKCETECTAGKYGRDCALDCSTNCVDTCDHVSGTCTCKPGWQVNKCTQACPSGRFGQNCADSCGNCASGAVCDRVTGYCPGGCKPGYSPTDPKCKMDCPADKWGQNCSGTCSTHCASLPSPRPQCDKTDGHCTCQPGYMPDLCINSCRNGEWGQDCSQSCSVHCDGVCDKADGSCPCKPGYQTGKCTAECDDGKYGQDCGNNCGFCFGGSSTCDHVTGNCSRCEDNKEMPLCKDCIAGQWGPTCGQRCGHCGGDGRCDPVNGACLPPSSSPCLDGWTTPTCDVKCNGRTYGPDCSQTCGHCRENSPCRHDNGMCEQDCADGYIGVLCQTEEESLIAPIVGSVVAAGALIAMAIVFAVCYLRRSSKDGPETPRKDFLHMERVDSVSNQQAEPSSQSDSQVYQNVATSPAAGGSVHDYERTKLGQRDSHAYAAHTAGKPAEQDPAHHTYQNTAGPSGPDAKPQKRQKGGRLDAVDATYGNITLERPEATYGNMKGQTVYGNVS